VKKKYLAAFGLYLVSIVQQLEFFVEQTFFDSCGTTEIFCGTTMPGS